MLRVETIKYDVNEDYGRNVRYSNVSTTDYYRRGRPYKLLGSPGSSSAKFKFNISNVDHTRYVNVFINHCRTTAHGMVDYFVNQDVFRTKYAHAPRDNFGVQRFGVSHELLQSGENWFGITLNRSSPGVYWISDVTITVGIMDPVHVEKHKANLNLRAQECSFEDLCKATVEELVSFCCTRRHVIESLRQISDEVDTLHHHILDAKNEGASLRMSGGLLCFFDSALRFFSTRTETRITAVLEDEGVAIEVAGCVVDVLEEVYERIKNSPEIKEMQAMYDEDQNLTQTIRKHLTEIKEISGQNKPEEVAKCLKLRESYESINICIIDLESVFTNVFGKIEFPGSLLDGEIGANLGLEDLINKVCEQSKNEPKEAVRIIRSFVQRMEEDLESIEDILEKLYQNMLKKVGRKLEHEDINLQDTFRDLEGFIGFRGRNFEYLKVLRDFPREKYDVVLKRIFRFLWVKMSNLLKIRDENLPITIVLICRGSVGLRFPKEPPSTSLPQTPYKFERHPEALLFPADSSLKIIFYQPWGVSIDPILVGFIAQEKVNHNQSYFFYEKSQIPRTRVRINELLPMKGWDFNRMESTERSYDLIPTVWMHYLDKNVSPHNEIPWKSVYDTESNNQFVFQYDIEKPLPLLVFTGLLMTAMDVIEAITGIRLDVVVRWAAGLAWSRTDIFGKDSDLIVEDNARIMSESIYQYRDTFQYELDTGRSVTMSQEAYDL